ncbi:Uncharacterised protein [Mycobacteroides abscessus subsp. abscessus]|nr:Uncharacterised protein [Mycobacteroides abscessus subsp. abscessus]
MASGACSSRAGSIDSRILTFFAARSSRDWPGSCFAPAVTTTTSESATTAGSSPPTTSLTSVNWVPWARSFTSASTLALLMS